MNRCMVKKTVYAAVIVTAMLLIAAMGIKANAVKVINNEPIKLMTSEEMEKKKKSYNDIIIEKCVGIVDDEKGNGHLKSNKNIYLYYGDIRYKGKRLKPGTMVITYYPCDPRNIDGNYFDPLCGYDYIKVTNKKGVKEKKLVDVRE